jgi:hypothetical protein
MSPEAARPAFERLIAALHEPRNAALLTAAVTPDIQIQRHTPGERGAVTAVAETFAGAAEVAGWLARTPPVVRFSLVGQPVAEAAEVWTIEYAITAGEFHNGGVWRAQLASDGRIAALSHHPFALPPGV